MTRPIRVLHLEDSPQDAEMLHAALRIGGVSADIVLVNSKERFEAALADEAFDLILSDYNVPGYDGIAAVKLAQQHRPDTPLIVVSGSVGEEEAIKCLQLGATDYLLKQRLDRLVPAVMRAVQEADDRRRGREAEARLRESEERFRQLAEQSSEGFWFVALNPERMLYVNPAIERIWGVPADRLYQDFRIWMEAIHEDDRARMRLAWDAWAKGEARPFDEECRVVRPDGSVRWVMTQGTQIHDETGALVRLSGLTQDITERRQLEAEFRHSQKMESVGQLAGGIAHDFNNLLTVILGNCELLKADRERSEQGRRDLEEIHKAAARAAGLTRQLLAFSRKQIIEPTLLNLNTIVTDTRGMLERLIGENIQVVLNLGGDLAMVKADRGQLEQVVMNLAVNARDAMPTGGILTIETGHVELGIDDVTTHVSVNRGSYVVLTVTDTGTGMTPEVQARLFEPFFTTKGVGDGTGLGLASVHGIVKQSGGSIAVDSEVGKGSSFRVYLPKADVTITVVEVPPVVAGPLNGTETVLVVEDAEGLRALAKRLLERQGYTVLLASDAEQALRMFSEHATIDLVLTDVMMPGISGPMLTKGLLEQRPALKIVHMSGYTDATIAHLGILDPGIAFLHKPFTSETLGRKIRDVLDR